MTNAQSKCARSFELRSVVAPFKEADPSSSSLWLKIGQQAEEVFQQILAASAVASRHWPLRCEIVYWRKFSCALSYWKRTAMHELSICESLLALLAQEAGRHSVKRITRVRVEIGCLSCVDPQALRFAFDALAPGTIAEAAELQIDGPPVRATCKDCAAVAKINSRLEPCPSCGGTLLELHGGDEMRLLEMEAA